MSQQDIDNPEDWEDETNEEFMKTKQEEGFTKTKSGLLYRVINQGENK